MLKMRQIRRRIKSVRNTQQITKTMEMVAAAKIRKAQMRIESARPYALKMIALLEDVAYHAGEVYHPLLEIRSELKRIAAVVIASNRGLCGAFNSNVLRRAEGMYMRSEKEGKEVKIISVGKKGLSYFRFREIPLYKSFIFSDEPSYYDSSLVADLLIRMYSRGEVDEVYLIFNHFKSLLVQRPVEHRMLPIVRETEEEGEEEARKEFLFEPQPGEVLKALLPTYIRTLVYRAFLESIASEQAARRAAMKNATNNAEEMIKNLTLQFNKARQAQITQEITEISTTAEAVKTRKIRGR